MLACFRRDLPGAAICLQRRSGSDTHARPGHRCGPQGGGEVEGLTHGAFTTNGRAGHRASSTTWPCFLFRTLQVPRGGWGRHGLPQGVGLRGQGRRPACCRDSVGRADAPAGSAQCPTRWVEAQSPACAPCLVVLLCGSWRPTAMLLCSP